MSYSPRHAEHEGTPPAGLGSKRKIFRTYPKDQVWTGRLEGSWRCRGAGAGRAIRQNLLYNPDNLLAASAINNRQSSLNLNRGFNHQTCKFSFITPSLPTDRN